MALEPNRLPSRIAVTGSSGYVGRGLIDRLEQDDAVEEVLTIDVRHPDRKHSSKVVFQKHDVAKPLGDMLRDHGTQAVVHLAFLLNSGHRQRAGHRVNVGGLSNLLNASEGVSYILYLSSSTIYGAHPDNPAKMGETAPVRPVAGFQYGENKAEAENILAEFITDHPSVTSTVLRACPIMGSSADNFVARAFTKPALVSVRGFDPPMQLVHEDDLTDVMTACLAQRPSGVFNLAGTGTIRWSEMAAEYGRRLIPLPAPLLYAITELTWRLRLQSDSPSCGLDFIHYPWTVGTEKIERELGVKLRYSAAEAWRAFVRSRSDAVTSANTDADGRETGRKGLS